MEDCDDAQVHAANALAPDALSEAAPACAADGLSGEAGISKAEARRRRKQERKVDYRAEAREKRLEKKKAQKRRRQEARQATLSAMSAEERTAFLEQESEAGRIRKAELQGSLLQAFESGAPKVVVNCSYSANMDHKELTSVAKQAQLCYTAVRDLKSRIQLHFTSLDAGCASLPSFEAIGVRGWTVHVHEAPVWELFDKEKLVVLSPDAEEELEDVREDLVYVVGGLVDRTVDKNRSASQAREHGAGTQLRKLPVKRFAPLGAHPVLNIDTVVRILARWLQNGGDWSAAFEECLPHRHSGQPTRRMLRKQRAAERKAAGGADAEGAGDEDGEGSESSESESAGAACDAKSDAGELPEAAPPRAPEPAGA